MYILTIDDKRQIVLPQELCDKLYLVSGGMIKIDFVNDNLVIQKVDSNKVCPACNIEIDVMTSTVTNNGQHWHSECWFRNNK